MIRMLATLIFALSSSAAFAQAVPAVTDTTKVVDLIQSINAKKLKMTLKLKAAPQIQQAINSYQVFLNIKEQGKPVLRRDVITLSRTANFKIIIYKGRLLSLPQLIALPAHAKDADSMVWISLNTTENAQAIQTLPRVKSQQVVELTEIRFPSPTERELLQLTLGNEKWLLNLHGWLHATVGDLKATLVNAAEVSITPL